MIRELDTVVLIHDLADYGLNKGDIGVVAHCYENGKAYEVEFVTADGNTVAILTLTDNDVRLLRHKEILHVRELSVA